MVGRMTSKGSWYASVVGTASLNDVAKRSGVALASLSRQVQANKLTIENAVKIARAFGASIPDTLISHGIVTAEELASVTVRTTLADATELDLLEELVRRTEARGSDKVPEGLQDEAIRNVREERGVNVGGSVQDAVVLRPDFTREVFEDDRAVASPRGADEGEDGEY